MWVSIGAFFVLFLVGHIRYINSTFRDASNGQHYFRSVLTIFTWLSHMHFINIVTCKGLLFVQCRAITWLFCQMDPSPQASVTVEPKHNILTVPGSKDHWANMGSTWVQSAPSGPHVSPINLAIRAALISGLGDWISRYKPMHSKLPEPLGLMILHCETYKGGRWYRLPWCMGNGWDKRWHIVV